MRTRADFRERRAQRRRRDRLTYVLIIAGVILLVGFVLLIPTLTPVGDVTVPEAYDYPSPEDHAIGDPNAPVVVEEFSDFQCPFCRKFHDETLPQIIDEYVRTGDVYFVYRHYPFLDQNQPSQESHAAANASICAGRQNRFWDFHDVLFANQTGENIGDYTERRLEAMAEALGLNMDEFNDCYGSADANAAVSADKLLGDQNSVTSTPSFLVNGQPLLGAQPFEVFQDLIESELEGG